MAEILMKGVELPKGEDVIELTIDSDGCIIFYDGHGKIEQYVEVIQPHGRLIDADALEAKIKRLAIADYPFDALGCCGVVVTAPTVLEASE